MMIMNVWIVGFRVNEILFFGQGIICFKDAHFLEKH